MVNLAAAEFVDAAGAERIIDAVRKRRSWLTHLFADDAYDRGKLMNWAAYRDFVIDRASCSAVSPPDWRFHRVSQLPVAGIRSSVALALWPRLLFDSA